MNSVYLSRPRHVRGEIYSKILDLLLTRLSFTITEGERELGMKCFWNNRGIQRVWFVYDTFIISIPSRKAKEFVIQPLLVRTFAVGITMHTIIRILQQSAVIG